jgi:hypothetical protein
MGLAFGSRCSSCSINSLGTPGTLAGFHVKKSLFSWRNLTSQESIVRSLKIDELKLYRLRVEIFSSPECYRKGDLIDGGSCCTRDNAMEGSPTRAQQRPG